MLSAILKTTVLAVVGIACFAAAPQDKKEDRTLKVKLNYTGAGTVDDQHKIVVFLFDSPDFAQGGVPPFATAFASRKNETVTFSNLAAATVYAAATFDPTGGYDGESGPPPSGSSLGLYMTDPGQPAPIKLEAGKPAEIELTFDDTSKMP